MSALARFGLALTVMAVCLPALADTWYGQQADEAVASHPVSVVMSDPEAWLDQPVRVSGRITDVCTHRGCWAVLESGGEMLRIKARDHSFAMPAEARGMAVAHGILERVELDAEHARHLVEDDGADRALLKQEYEYRLDAVGILIE